MRKLDSSLIGLLRKLDSSFELVADQRYTASPHISRYTTVRPDCR